MGSKALPNPRSRHHRRNDLNRPLLAWYAALITPPEVQYLFDRHAKRIVTAGSTVGRSCQYATGVVP